MILLSEKYIYNIRNNSLFVEQIRNELFVSVLLNNICLPGTFLLGEEGNSPDLINNNKDIGYEITQCDLDCDLDSKYISIALNETNYDYNTFSQKIAEYGVDINKYHFNISEDGKVLSFGPDGKGNAPYYFLEIFKKNFIKKFKKLNKGNYNNCKETSLIFTSVSRHKDDTDAKEIFKQYIKCCEEFEINFKKLYLITSSKIYIFANNEVKSFSVDEKWSSSIVETNKILKFVKNKTTLYSEFPTLCFEWGPNEKTPLDYGCKSGESVNWKCEKGHIYDAVINKRTTRGNGCPYCSGHRVLAGFNDLQTTHPQISIQWHPTLNENKKPCDYSKGSMEEVWWLCPNGHLIFKYDKKAVIKDNLCCVEYVLENTGKTEIDSVCILSTQPRTTSITELKNRQFLIDGQYLSYEAWSDKRFIKPGETISIKVCYLKDKAIVSPISAIAAIYLQDINGNLWHQALFCPTKEIENSIRTNFADFKNRRDVALAIECFKKPYLW